MNEREGPKRTKYVSPATPRDPGESSPSSNSTVKCGVRADGNGVAERGWVSLFSGGKDSSLALYRALERGLDVKRLVTVHPEGDSFMYHVPATNLASLAAESIGIPLLEVEPASFERESVAADDSAVRGDEELDVLETALRERFGGRGADSEDRIEPWQLAGVIAGAVESEYQARRIEAMCERLDCEYFAPLWRANPHSIANELLETGFEVIVVAVAAAGLDESWLGRPLDRSAMAELETLNDQYGVHPLGEGGEFETLVVDGPHMSRRIDLEYDTEWDGVRGRLRVTEAKLS